ncbi:DUF502 domain-containing protein [Endozoicomonas ascidiicola]|uniref:DUF502 domain-containing protein n=1 Tax=Endozoicomonas ascidiicola TaxID=1698521 RepID=UPI00082E2842|nr:DUF502 domain-containing protein [Endozoicomonas ascidiicola]
MSRIMGWFLEGLAVLVPIVFTFYLFSKGMSLVAELLSATVGSYLGRELTLQGEWQVVSISLLLVVGFTIFVGVVTHMWLGSHLLRLLDQLLNHIPLVKLVYAAIKDGVNAIIGDRREFEQPVLVAIGDIQVPGFVTRKDVADFGVEGHVAVYFPMAFSIAGRVVLVSADRIKMLDKSSAEVMSFLVSGGVTSGKK